MASLGLTTGMIDNSAVAGVRPTSTLVVRIANDGTATSAVQVNGYYQSGGGKVQYVAELLTLGTGSVVRRDYHAQFDGFEFQFLLSSPTMEPSVWGKDAQGNLVTAHRLVTKEIAVLGENG
ncbi:Hypothetical protein DEACI_0994 [Acididesulfobacillus acetoxydans]|uniref:Uncharacterized protein n=1 Tax=Acididesulfobacillus acetoxydans TaxID=1561005 RepID=A0A8S0WWK1_9FIRM|nr:hypothetical protein [Acididesulfobacillus acetoxydans]CAA7600341.1 Hypothetical protein DEACI_0994 [Acididesulfobacillus acetoxydans]CEJ07863.1 Hypothetical protein DEACI_2329 [Acididesulfobacillus acetoxydans]